MRIILYIILLTILSGCSIPGAYYIRNLTHSEATIKLLYVEDINFDELVIPYDTKLRKIKYRLFEKLGEETIARKTGNKKITFTIPPTSIAFFDFGTNFRLYTLQGLEVECNGKSEFISSDNTDRIVVETGFMNYTGYLDIE